VGDRVYKMFFLGRNFLRCSLDTTPKNKKKLNKPKNVFENPSFF